MNNTITIGEALLVIIPFVAGHICGVYTERDNAKRRRLNPEARVHHPVNRHTRSHHRVIR